LEEAKAYQRALLEKGIPATSFEVDDIDQEYQRLSEKGVVFKDAPKVAGPVKIARFHDTVGNLIQMHQAI
jgi:predicted enzyme related to lactoylglutathione lyase